MDNLVQDTIKNRKRTRLGCHAIHISNDDSLRRTANQAFFDKLYITETDAVDSEAGEPFGILFNWEVQSTALRRTQGGRGPE